MFERSVHKDMTSQDRTLQPILSCTPETVGLWFTQACQA